MFDVPLPMRRAPRETSTAADDSPSESTVATPNTMAFSLMTKKGNRQQVWSSFDILLTNTQLTTIDSNDRDALGFAIRDRNEKPKGSGASRAAADQEFGPELRSARLKYRPEWYRH